MERPARIRPFAPLIAALLILLFMLACRSLPGLARLWQRALALPLARALHRIPVPFPLLEPLALLLATAMLACALRFRAGGLRTVAWLAVAALAGYGLLWYPNYWAMPAESPAVPTVSQLEWLCGALIDALNDAALASPTPEAALSEAPEAAGLPGARVKAARYPEWMRLARVAGLYSPWTGEALVDPTAPPPLLPFTAVHELMHLEGIADEGAANIAAWQRCLAHGGIFADSARLWALRYAMGLLGRVDPRRCEALRPRMSDALAEVFDRVGGGIEALPRPTRSALGLQGAADSYEALVGWLAAGNDRL